MIQLGIILFGCTAVFLSQDARHSVRRFAPIVGLCGQPFWAMSAIAAEQWGVLFITGIYTLSWCRGVYNFWIKPRLAV